LPVVARQVAVEPMVERWRALRALIERAEIERSDDELADKNDVRAGGVWRRLAARLTGRRARHGAGCG
jgi:hypothetical protein